MLQSTYRTFQDALFSPNPVVRRLVLAGLLASGLMVITFFIGVVGPLLALATAAAIIGGVLILNDTHWGFVALCGVVFLIPFASLPFSIGFKPTFLDVALGALFFVWIFKLIIGQQEEFIASPIGLLVMLFLLLALFSFALGLTHSPANTFLLRRFLEILIGIALFFVVANTVRSEGEAIWVTRWVMLAGWSAATIAVLFYVLPQESTVALLDRMARFDYPGGFGALRFIEDDPNGTMRAIGTSVDPNVLGGMMILTAALMLPQLVSSQPIFPRWFTFVMLATAMTALYLTYSRSALLGLASVMALLAVLKYRKLIPLGIAAGLLLLLLPITQEYVARLLEGFAGEDLATQMRFGEYKDALILIERYPLFGVGFTGTPDMDIYLGVSMLYLTIAENMGVIGLGMFVAVMAGFFIMAWRAWRKGLNVQMEALLLGYAGAIVGALVSGIFDHYWFNMTYPHMTVLFWLYVGMATAVILITRQPAAEPRTRV
ncbi:MAG: O-antigen ligase family protein [Caldilinea sp.]